MNVRSLQLEIIQLDSLQKDGVYSLTELVHRISEYLVNQLYLKMMSHGIFNTMYKLRSISMMARIQQ